MKAKYLGPLLAICALLVSYVYVTQSQADVAPSAYFNARPEWQDRFPDWPPTLGTPAHEMQPIYEPRPPRKLVPPKLSFTGWLFIPTFVSPLILPDYDHPGAPPSPTPPP
eukprot:CAMPEP_0174357434 /NCGR_PEP_ID=MMETSP0811_2-20130205/36000_1 /TAXON_ID=73025 ORGANISM="Eutreptiella gymnastica-like, Strain CCMP1594" /NCGR_SAMPLE_ID=MMETSP0811_2 /ASSEMBLY_ACC=CAM_ASM_000667 /LENGTH=109 /DNA_ID=CAMNT_0015490253 /DNA_START=40 /DNA_END=366 /DNA_ORIENTATION=-